MRLRAIENIPWGSKPLHNDELEGNPTLIVVMVRISVLRAQQELEPASVDAF